MKHIKDPGPVLGGKLDICAFIHHVVDNHAAFNTTGGAGIRAGARLQSARVQDGYLTIERDQDHALLIHAIEKPEPWHPQCTPFPEFRALHPETSKPYGPPMPARMFLSHIDAIRDAVDEKPEAAAA